MDPWWKQNEPREEVRKGRSFNPDEFAIALEQVVAGTAPSITGMQLSSFPAHASPVLSASTQGWCSGA
ncbi:hypothetical protein [Syntrophorhabdus aromaticivorans]|jgi:hypothetical protein|uniref:hypothetical protein n=1 Tax=Syntrophorhabdus aromaticivorans TaxID=328301 RepID=UPI0004280385|nr:hypothetical protein [Syntrophorhabdus aromaticivorans]